MTEFDHDSKNIIFKRLNKKLIRKCMSNFCLNFENIQKLKETVYLRLLSLFTQPLFLVFS